MPKRKKRARKAIKSLEKQIEIHKRKLESTDFEPRRGYYTKEIERLRREREKRKRIAEG